MSPRTNLTLRFGQLVAAHRRRTGLTQVELAEKAAISVDMVSKIEAGTSGARFPTIEKLAAALGVDPAELFTSELPDGIRFHGKFADVTARLSSLSEADLIWVDRLLDAALKRRGI